MSQEGQDKRPGGRMPPASKGSRGVPAGVARLAASAGCRSSRSSGCQTSPCRRPRPTGLTVQRHCKVCGSTVPPSSIPRQAEGRAAWPCGACAGQTHAREAAQPVLRALCRLKETLQTRL